jgi:putative ABC transport system permease protein
MLEVLRNMFRRKTRTILTVFGITIGIFAFTVMGSMAEKISLLVRGGSEYYADKVTISQSDTLFLTGPLDIGKGDEIAKVEGVAAITPTVTTTIKSGDVGAFGPPASISGSVLAIEEKYESFEITFSSGRQLTDADRGKVTVGTDLVKKLNAKVGGTVKIRDRIFEVVGIMNKTLTTPDNSVFMTLPDAQAIYFEEVPEILRQQSRQEDVVNGFVVYIDPGVEPNKLAERINNEVDDIKAFGPKAFEDQIASVTSIFNAILFGVALISLIVGGLSVINTMTMAISERTREIGIKKAIGAKKRNILGEYLTEAALIGLFGGLIGWALGALTVLAVNGALEASGNQIFLLSWRITIIAITFSVILGVLAGFYPAYHAVKIKIVQALRQE